MEDPCLPHGGSKPVLAERMTARLATSLRQGQSHRAETFNLNGNSRFRINLSGENRDQTWTQSRAKTGIQQPGRRQQMIRQSLRQFVARVLRAKQITYQDVRILQREILSDGLSTRDEAEALIALDQAVPKSDPAWAGHLVNLVVDFAVWESRPTGYVDEDT